MEVAAAMSNYREHARVFFWAFAGVVLMFTGLAGVRFAARILANLFHEGAQRLVLVHTLGLIVVGVAAMLVTLWGIAWQVASGMAVFDSWNQSEEPHSVMKNDVEL